MSAALQWAARAGEILEAAVGELSKVEREHVERELARGGWLRLVLDQPGSDGRVRLRVRLISNTGPNVWIYDRTAHGPPAAHWLAVLSLSECVAVD